MNIEIMARCANCGADLDERDFSTTKSGDIVLEVAPCPACLEAARQEGIAEG